MLRASALTIVVMFAAAGPAAFAQLPPQPPPVQRPLQQGTDQERAACHPDVMRFCKAEVDANADDVFGILNCLQTNRARISRACQAVLANHGQ
jgi:hypothetical protein